MSTLKETCEALQGFLDTTKDLTNLYDEEQLGRILYSSLLKKPQKDGRVGFGPREIWNTSNEDLIKLVNLLEQDLMAQSRKDSLPK